MPSRRTRSTLSGCHHSMMSDGPRVHLRPSRTCTGTRSPPPSKQRVSIREVRSRPTSGFWDHDARSFLAALRRHHDRPFGEFWDEDLELGDDEEGYTWETTDDATIDALEQFLSRRQSRYSLASSSVDALRTRLNLYVRAYQEANGTNDLPHTDSTRPRESSLRSR